MHHEQHQLLEECQRSGDALMDQGDIALLEFQRSGERAHYGWCLNLYKRGVNDFVRALDHVWEDRGPQDGGLHAALNELNARYHLAVAKLQRTSDVADETHRAAAERTVAADPAWQAFLAATWPVLPKLW